MVGCGWHWASERKGKSPTLKQIAAQVEANVLAAIIKCADPTGEASLADVSDTLEAAEQMPDGGEQGIMRRVTSLAQKGLVQVSQRGHRVRGHNQVSHVRLLKGTNYEQRSLGNGSAVV